MLKCEPLTMQTREQVITSDHKGKIDTFNYITIQKLHKENEKTSHTME